jgi:hypothetical protein
MPKKTPSTKTRTTTISTRSDEALTPESFLTEIGGLELLELATEIVKPPIPFWKFVERTSAIKCEPWQVHLCNRLERLATEKATRLLIHKPPRRGGSVIASQRLGPYLMGRDPSYRFRLVTHNQTHSEVFSEVMQGIIRSPEYKYMFPRTKLPRQTNLAEWSTTVRDAIKDGEPSFMALGIAGQMVGLGGNFIIDDPYSNPAEAMSPIINQKIWDWHRYGLMGRIEPESNIVVMFHRFHPDDYAGRLIAEGGWEIIRYTDLAEENDFLGREIDEPLSPRTPFTFLDEKRNKDPLMFAGMHQGLPSLPEGNAFKRDWYETKESFNPKDMRNSAIYFDLAGTDNPKGDQTVGTFGSRMSDDTFWWWWQMAGRWNPPERDQKIEEFCHVCCTVLNNRQLPIYLESGIGLGVDSVQRLRNKLIGSGFNVKFDPVNTSKYERANAQHDSFRSASAAKRIKLYFGDYFSGKFKAGSDFQKTLFYDGKSKWIEPFLTEICRLQEKRTDRGIVYVGPAGSHDDRLDSGTGLHNKLTHERTRLTADSLNILNSMFQ